MSVTVVVGGQFGDEAKGKINDFLSSDAKIIARYNGGDNAGHTVVNEHGKFSLRLIPSGFSNSSAVCVLGPGVVLNLSTLIQEITILQEAGFDLSNRLWISPRCHVVMPYHQIIERIYEQAKGSLRTDTTNRGIGPAYADKVSYNGIRLFDLFEPSRLLEKYRVQFSVKQHLLKAFGYDQPNEESTIRTLLEQFEIIADYVKEPFGLIQSELEKGVKIIVEAAQSALIDNDWGTYPYCTASTTLAGGVTAGLGIPPNRVSRVISVVKSYGGRVGNGPLPTELNDDMGNRIRAIGHEYGTVTGRPRRCGWFDAVLVRFSSQLNGASELALTKLDVLDGIPKLKICMGYTNEGDLSQSTLIASHTPQYWNGDAIWLGECEPIYEVIDGWTESTGNIKKYWDLPHNARIYAERIEELVGVKVSMISVGPHTHQTIIVP